MILLAFQYACSSSSLILFLLSNVVGKPKSSNHEPATALNCVLFGMTCIQTFLCILLFTTVPHWGKQNYGLVRVHCLNQFYRSQKES